MAEFVDYLVSEGVAEITMHREPVNAINMQLAREVIDAYKQSKDDAEYYRQHPVTFSA